MSGLRAALSSWLGRGPEARDEEPIRAELYSVERLEQFAATLAAEHEISRTPRRGRKLLPRLEENGRRLVSAYNTLAEAISGEHTISPAAEWLVDNFHIVEEQLREIREDLPKSYYYELPKLTTGDLAGYPRVYAVALAIIAHTDSRLESQTMQRFVRSYQRVAPLTIGELWALAISLRLALVENLRRLATRIVSAREERDTADRLSDKILELAGRQPEQMIPLVSARLGKREDLDRAFIVELTQRLREQDPSVTPVFDWLERQLRKRGQSIELVVHLEHQRQAAAQVTVGNIITSMRLLSTLDWRDFFESVSLVDPLLGEDPAGVYSGMDFRTRDRYRHVVERIAKRTRTDELEVAREAVQLAAAAKREGAGEEARAHVGFFLIDDGLAQLERHFNYSPRVRESVRRAVLARPTLFYLGTVGLLTAWLVAALVLLAYLAGASVPVLVALALLSLIPASDLALSVTNWDVTHLFAPRLLPRMETSRGVAEEATTFVVVPTMFTSVAAVSELLERLEVHFLANRDERFYFALLGDYADAEKEETDADAVILDAALDGIAALNERHAEAGRPARFHLFLRRRLWNEGEGRWMGWERKRGKLQEFNRLLRGARDTTFVVATADAETMARVRYVVTLDSDTQLPRDAARKLVGVMTHPLNRPHFDEQADRVTRGYAILQPRVSITLESASRSRFARVFSGNTGFDPYTTAASDVYQDLFAEGSFTGKGLYDVDAFERALSGRVPENCLLSHDLFEGLFARCALVSDIEMLDDYPARYDAFAKRQHRWTRGDWQIARWLLPVVPDARGGTRRNRLPVIARWKILDNLRRSLVAPSVVVWLAFAWSLLPGSAALWSLFVLVMLAFPVYAHVTTALLHHPRGVPWTSHFWSVWGDARKHTAQVFLTVTFLAHQAYLMTDAVARTLYRKLVSHRRLLEWMTAAQAEKRAARSLAGLFGYMWPTELVVAAVGAAVAFARPEAFNTAAPLLALWAVSPLVAHWASAAVREAREVLTAEEVRQARHIARSTWRFFEEFVGEEDNWLPPDNFQEDPQPVVAHRTSPTNIGLLLLSTVAAHDFGYIGTLEQVERLERTFATLERMQRFRGHFFNWYDTRTLEPLAPQYVSTVDSGNLAGHLIALRQSCIELHDRALFGAHTLAGLSDTLAMLGEEVGRLGAARQRTEAVSIKELRDEVEACAEIARGETPRTLSAWADMFDRLDRRAEVVEDIVETLAQEYGEENFAEVSFWTSALHRQVGAFRRDQQTFAPWAVARAGSVGALELSLPGALGESWGRLVERLERVCGVAEMADAYDTALTEAAALAGEVERGEGADAQGARATLEGLRDFASRLESAAEGAREFASRLSRLAGAAGRFFEEMDFDSLLDPERKVFHIGHNVSAGRADNSFFDLLASESRLASFAAIAKGDVPQEHWFRLGRQLAPVERSRALISWTATMFEYLMPVLVMRSYAGTLLDQTHRAAVARQIEYGAERGVPWGISESAYNARDLHLHYQYGPFGVPGLGLKRGLADDLVVAPYATLLAAQVAPRRAMENLRRLTREGAYALYGFYESIDYTPARVPQGEKRVMVRAFMAHHQGMGLVALDNVINANAMQERFHADPLVQATELLLQERIPSGVRVAHPRAEEVMSGRVVRSVTEFSPRVYDTASLPTPRVQLLSNGTYSVMVTTAGAGYSACGPVAVTRWREDVTRDNYGAFIYVRDVRADSVWSVGRQPLRGRPTSYEVTLAEDKVDIERNDGGVLTHTEIIVSPEDNAEVRRVTLTNRTSRAREIEVTSYAEVVLAPQAADVAHPAFSNLFIETEFVAAANALIARRRPRSSKEKPVYAVHVVAAEGETVGATQYETDRSRFLGRGHTPANPLAIIEERPLSNTVGAVLDPVFSLRRRVRLLPGQRVRLTFTTAVAESREQALELADKYHDASIFGRVAQFAWTNAQVAMRHLRLDPEEAHLFQRLAGRVLYSDPSLRPRPHVLSMNTKTQTGLWPYGIGGDLPIVLVRLGRSEDLNMVRQILRGHEYLRLKGLQIDLVILNDHPTSYAQSLQDEIQMLVRTSGQAALQDKPGGVYLRRSDLMPDEDRILLHAVARVVIVTERGTLAEQLVSREIEDEQPPRFVPRQPSRTYPEPGVATPELTFFNGLGGFNYGGREYVIVLGEGQWTPAPWTNVVANERDFGFQVTETGAGYTWSVNSRENRLTPWSNDAVTDPAGECIYLRDEDTGTIWTTTPLPVRETEPYVVRHGQGYTVFEHTSHGFSQELLQFVPSDAPVKISVLRLRNRTDRRRRLSVTSYAELVLGVTRGASAPHVVTEIDKRTGAILARNAYNNEFATRVAFADVSAPERTLTCDRKEFIGRNGQMTAPRALRRTHLSGRVGAGLDPCAALQTTVELAPGEARELVFLLGQGESVEEARAVVERFRRPGAVNEAFEHVLSHWDSVLDRVKVRTPDPAMDTILNRWLVYQTLACRVLSRSAFYQSGGAYGFRDQLQDVMALVYTRPDLARAQIVRAAGRQFKEGDVQHWWHPPTGRGVRTRFSDDLLWLPYVASFYVSVTGDRAVLDEIVPFIEAPALEEGVDEAYTVPTVSTESATIYEHCARALDRSLKVGAHGLPLMGSGDWNDGMNRVGHGGRGESVWVGWFLHTTLQSFARFSEERKDSKRAESYRAHVPRLKDALEKNAWDGDWYRRAYFDDGTPLGSATNDACRIDSIAQSWSVISGAADP
ncbi:MAG TPA: glucoamylase family protein, partial [Pyrinomonadaceae bacterium]|nr:glucoamylase family protein [Pyrinomonadaceae bacterium]